MFRSPEQRAQFQRVALVAVVVLLAAVAADRLTHLVRPAFAQDHFAFAHEVNVEHAFPFEHEFAFDVELPPHQIAQIEAEARRMAEEAQQMAEEHRRIAEEHRRMAEEQRCEIERARERAQVRVVEVR